MVQNVEIKFSLSMINSSLQRERGWAKGTLDLLITYEALNHSGNLFPPLKLYGCSLISSNEL